MSRREGRWKSDAIKAYTRDNIQDSKRVSRKVVVAREAKEETVGGRDSQGSVSYTHLTLPTTPYV